MKKILALLAGLTLFYSCEKSSEHYTYEDIVPGTTVKEIQLGKSMNHTDFLKATNEIRYEHVRSYACRKSNGKVYYSLDIGEAYGGIERLQYQFNQDFLNLYVETDATWRTQIYTLNYIFDEEKMTLTDMYHIDISENIENKLLYADEEYLIFETKGLVDDDRYYTRGADFSRIIYRSVEGDDLIIPTDTVHVE